MDYGHVAHPLSSILLGQSSLNLREWLQESSLQLLSIRQGYGASWCFLWTEIQATSLQTHAQYTTAVQGQTLALKRFPKREVWKQVAFTHSLTHSNSEFWKNTVNSSCSGRKETVRLSRCCLQQESALSIVLWLQGPTPYSSWPPLKWMLKAMLSKLSELSSVYRRLGYNN